MTAADPTFTVVIPTHNGRESVRSAVDSVLKQTYPHFELIVASDGEGARTRELLGSLSDSRLRVVDRPKKGVSAARNFGASCGSAPWVTFLDDDDTARPNWLDTWAQNIDDNVAAVTGNLSFRRDGQHSHTVVCRLSTEDRTMDASILIPGGYAIRRDHFHAIDGFNEQLTYAENQDLGLRLCDWIAARNPGFKVVHSDITVADSNREAIDARQRRYKSAPAQAARRFLSHHSERLKADPSHAAALHRIISRAARVEGRDREAILEAIKAISIRPLQFGNHRSFIGAVGAAAFTRWRAAWSELVGLRRRMRRED